jgi:hypothetical protein
MRRNLEREVRFLEIYAALITLSVAAMALMGFRPSADQQKTRFTEVDVERLNLVEKDGKLDMVIANSERMPPPIVGGKTFTRHGDRSPGILFYNGNGDEDGGLAFGGRTENGVAHAGADLMFDQYNQDQTVGISYDQEDGKPTAGFRVWDRPETPVAEIVERMQAVTSMPEGPAKQEALQQLQQAKARGDFGALRVFMGKTPDRVASLVLSDPTGKPRLKIAVDGAGNPTISFLDEKGNVAYSLPPSEKK